MAYSIHSTKRLEWIRVRYPVSLLRRATWPHPSVFHCHFTILFAFKSPNGNYLSVFKISRPSQQPTGLIKAAQPLGSPFHENTMRDLSIVMALYHGLGIANDFCHCRNLSLGPRFSVAIYIVGTESFSGLSNTYIASRCHLQKVTLHTGTKNVHLKALPLGRLMKGNLPTH